MSATLTITIGDDGWVRLACTCGDVHPHEAPPAGAARMVRTFVPAHVGLHAQAESKGIPWEHIQGLLEQSRANMRRDEP